MVSDFTMSLLSSVPAIVQLLSTAQSSLHQSAV